MRLRMIIKYTKIVCRKTHDVSANAYRQPAGLYTIESTVYVTILYYLDWPLPYRQRVGLYTVESTVYAPSRDV